MQYLKEDKYAKSQAFLSAQVDILGIDEYADSPEEVIAPLIACTDASPVKIVGKFGTQTIQFNQFHKEYEMSTQKNWHIKCPSCGFEQILIDFKNEWVNF